MEVEPISIGDGVVARGSQGFSVNALYIKCYYNRSHLRESNVKTDLGQVAVRKGIVLLAAQVVDICL